MTRSEAFKHMSNIVNTQLFPVLRGDSIDSKHRNYVESMIRQLYDTLENALRDQKNDRYQVRYGCDSSKKWSLDIKDGFVGCSNEPECYISFVVNGYVSPFTDIDKVPSPFLRRRIRNIYPKLHIMKMVTKRDADFYDIFKPSHSQCEELDITPTSFSLKAKRRFFDDAEVVFEYRKGLPFFDYCTFKEYI